MRGRIALAVISGFLAACGGGGGGGGTPVTAPSGLSYPSPFTAKVGTAVTTLTPTVTGTVTGYSVSPALPAGLSLSMSSGAITGTPTTVTAQATYTITASNSGGSTTFMLSLTVVPAAPTNLSYSGTPLTAVQNHVIQVMLPTVTGTVDSYATTPALPAGLFLDPVSGVISGTPKVTAALLAYQITATNAGGVATFSFQLRVIAPLATDTGILRGSVITGVDYNSSANPNVTNGTTGADSHFQYDVGSNVIFSIGAATLGSAPGAALLMSVDLQPGHTGTSNDVTNLERFLMMLDTNNDPSNGIQISAVVRGHAAGWTTPINFNQSPAAFEADPNVVSIVADASAADGVAHTLPLASTAQTHLKNAYLCSYSGGFIGTYDDPDAHTDNGRFAAEVLPDGSVEVIGYSFVDAVNLGFDGLQPTPPATSPTAMSLTLDRTFSVADAPVAATGSFSDPDNISGTWTVTGTGGGDGTFTAARVGGIASSPYRFTGDIEDAADPNNVLGMFVIDTDGGSNVAGFVFAFDGSSAQTVTGTISGGNFTGNVGTIPAIGTFNAGALTFDGNYMQNGKQINFVTDGCRLN